jgi:aldehyde dehydrogenase (NAD+)
MSDETLANSRLGALEYDAAPESAAIARLRPSYGLFINGQFTDPASHQSFASLNPATEETLAMVAQASAADVDRAVGAARAAYEGVWSKTPGRSARSTSFASPG